MDSTIDVFVREESTLSVGHVPKFLLYSDLYFFPVTDLLVPKISAFKQFQK